MISARPSRDVNYIRKENSSHIPAISIDPPRRLSISSPLRFTRTFSEDSLDSIEKTGRKELLRRKMLSSQETAMNLMPAPNACPLLREMGRSRTEPADSSDNLRIPSMLKRSTGDLTREHTSKRTLGEVIGLTLYQHKLITQAWPNIYSTGCNGQFASNIYDFLCRKCPKARILFKKANTVASFAQTDDCYALHAKVTVELIDAAIRGLDTEHVKFTSYVNEIGRSHRHLRAEGLTTGMWDELGDAIIEALRRYESVRKHKELRRAWLALIAYITDNMKQGQTVLRSSSSYDICDYGSPKKV